MMRVLFKPSAFTWLFWVSAIYFVVGMVNIFIHRFADTEYIQLWYVLILSLPLWFEPLASFLKMRTLWDNKE